MNFSDGFFTDCSDILAVLPTEAKGLLKLYAAEHNPSFIFEASKKVAIPISASCASLVLKAIAVSVRRFLKEFQVLFNVPLILILTTCSRLWSQIYCKSCGLRRV